MAYLGNAPARSFISFERQVFTIVNSQTAYALSHSVANENDIRLVVNNVVQEPGSGKAYTATGTALTLSAALTNGTDEMYCVFLGRATATSAPGAGSVGTSQLADLNVTSGKIANDAVTLAKMASGTDGNIISYDASGNPVAVATGSSGQVLTSAGAGAQPAFATPGGGDVVLLHTTAAMSGSTVAVDNVFSATYKSYRVIITNYYPAADTIPEFQFRNGGGASNDSKYCYVHDRVERNSGGVATATTASAWNNTLAAWQQEVDGGSASYTSNAIIDIFNPILTIPTWWTTASNGWDNSRAWIVNMTGGGVYNNSSAIDGIQFSTSSGNISGGVLKIYGFK